MKKILVVNVNWLGDVIFSAPIFRALHVKYPQSQISCMAVPRVAEVLKQIPFIDNVIIYEEKGCHQSTLGKLKIIGALRREKFDVAFLLHGSMTRALLIFLAGIPVRVGYATKKRGSLLTHIVKRVSSAVHRSDHYLQVIESFGVEVKQRKYELSCDKESEVFAEKFIAENGIKENDFLAILNIGGNWDLKRWPEENFAHLADRLQKELKAKVAISGAPKDVDSANQIVALTQATPIVFAGKTTLSQLFAVLKRASIVISADSGPLHAASSVGTETIALFGPTHPKVTGPRGIKEGIIIRQEVGCNDKPCYHLDCKDNICMKAISVDDVIERIKENGC
ncbi:MAG: lipopolysaccharide heptosyltransferase II [Candidatus Aceula meridiana]|nr:lipopolysaccharide heptosyltransferase II [Candidatus Aceula meridiana]